MKSISDGVKEFLFAAEGAGVFAVLDGASVAGLREKLHQTKPESVCLYRGELEPDMAEVAPYLVRLERDSEFTAWVLTEGWGNHWGIFVSTQAGLHAMRQHFRRFLIVHDSTGKPLYFRFYDPRVLRNYLPTCDREQLEQMFGPAASYVAEADQPGVLLCFRLKSGALAVERKDLAAGAEIRR
jgi:hypothetical protein